MKASQVAWVVKKPPANAGDVRDMGSIPGLGRSPGEGIGYPLQYSCLENAMGSRAWQAMVHRITQSQTWLKWLSTHTHTHTHTHIEQWRCFPGGAVIKNPPANARDTKDMGLIPGLGKSPGWGNGNPLWYSCWENPMDRGTIGFWWDTVQEGLKSWKQLSD